MMNCVCKFFKIRVVFRTLYLCDFQLFFALLKQVTHYLTAIKIFEKSVDWELFARKSLILVKFPLVNRRDGGKYDHCLLFVFKGP